MWLILFRQKGTCSEPAKAVDFYFSYRTTQGTPHPSYCWRMRAQWKSIRSHFLKSPVTSHHFKSLKSPFAWTVVSCPPDIKITFSPKAAPGVSNQKWKELRSLSWNCWRLDVGQTPMDSSRCALWNLGFDLSIPENDIENEEMPQQVRSAQQDCTVAHGTKKKCHDSRWSTNYLSHIVMLYHGNAQKKEQTNFYSILVCFPVDSWNHVSGQSSESPWYPWRQ